MNKYTKTLLACAAVAGLYAGTAAARSYAADDKTTGQAAPADTSKDKSSCSGKSGCSGKASCSGKTDTNAKASDSSDKDKAKSSCSTKASCSGKDGCSAKADTKDTSTPKQG